MGGENAELRAEMRRNGVKQWEVAEALGVGESTLVRWMRRSLDAKARAACLRAILEIVRRREGE